jgi:2-oxoglutarate ferredoxin oxidoreductase subunit alpha
MNPPALQGQPRRPAPRRHVIVDTDEFTKRNLTKVGYAANPLETARSTVPVHAFR